MTMASPVTLALSGMPRTWLIDLDGTVLRHNGHIDGNEQVLPGVHAFWAQIAAHDMVVVVTAREETRRAATLAVLDAAGLRYDHALFGVPYGERIVINDRKPSGLNTAVAVNVPRNGGLGHVRIVTDPTL